MASWLEISELVEHTVVGKVYLVITRYELPILRNGGRIEYVVLPIDESDDRRDVACAADDLVERFEIRIDELRLEQQVFRRVSRQHKLGKCDDVRIDIARAIHPLDDFASVSLHVANDDVNLSHRQTQLRRVLHEGPALRSNARAIVTER